MSDDLARDDVRGALLPGRVGLFVRLASNPGGRPGLLDALNRYADRLADESHTEVFVIGIDPEDPDVVWLYEWFSDEAGLEAHRHSDHFNELVSEIPHLLSAPPGLLRVDPIRLHMQTMVLEENPVTG